MRISKLFLAMAVMSSPVLANQYQSSGSIDLYGTQFNSAAKAPTDVINKLRYEEYVYEQRFDLQSSFSLSNVDSFVDKVDLIEEDLTRTDLSLSDANSLIGEHEGSLAELGDARALEFHSKLYFPYFPISFKVNEHNFSVFFEIGAGASLDFMDSEITYNPISEELETDSAVRLKSYTHSVFGLDYAVPLLKQKKYSMSGGFRFNVHNVGLYKEVRSIDGMDDTNVEDLIFDEYNDLVENETKVGIDVSVRFENREGTVVVGVRNLNEPNFTYNSVSDYCNEPENVSARDCASAQHFVSTGEMNNAGAVKMFRQAYVQATHKLPHLDLRVSGYIEANRSKDFLGNWAQIARGELAYAPNDSWLSGTFLGYERNLTGHNQRKLIAGLSFFDRIKFTGYSTTKTVKVDGKSLPEDFGFSLSLKTSF